MEGRTQIIFKIIKGNDCGLQLVALSYIGKIGAMEKEYAG